VRKIICDHKVSGQQWLNIARNGARKSACVSNATMLYGTTSKPKEGNASIIFLALRGLQDENARLRCISIPLAFHPANTGLAHLPPPTGYHDLKSIAISRLLLDNSTHIKALLG